MNKINLISIVLLLVSSTAFSQVINKNRNTYWADAGIGNFISTDNANGRTIQLGANFERDSLLIKIRYQKHTGIHSENQKPLDDYFSLGMMAGRKIYGKNITFHYCGGLALLKGTKRGKLLYTSYNTWFPFLNKKYYDSENFSTLSVPVELGLLINPIKYTGIGLTLFGDLNFTRPTCSLALTVGIGKLK